MQHGIFRFSEAAAWLDRFRRSDAADNRLRLPVASLTRRQVLIGSAAGSAGLLLRRSSPTDVQVSQTAEGVVVRLGDLSWSVLRSAFGQDADIRYRARSGEHWIRVQRSGSAQIGVPTDFTARLRMTASGWGLTLRLECLEASFEVPFEEWLQGSHPAVARTTGATGPRPRNGFVRPDFRQCDATLTLHPDWRLQWKGEEPVVSVVMNGFAVSAREAQLSLGRRHAQDVLDILDDALGDGGATFELLNPKIEHASAQPGTVGSEQFALDFDSIKKAQIGIIETTRHKVVRVFGVVGEAEVSLSGGASTPTLVGLRFAPVALVHSQSDGASQCLLTARVARAAHSIEAGNLILSIAAADDEGIIAVFRDGVAPPFAVAAELHEAHVPVRGADVGAFNFVPVPLSIAVGGNAAPEPDYDEDPWVAARRGPEFAPLPVQAIRPESPSAKAAVPEAEKRELAAAQSGGLLITKSGQQPVFIAPLEKSRLQILRSRDLLSLSFGFRNFSLDVRQGHARLVPRRLEPKDGGGDSDRDAISHKLIVEFPPQHVAEHAKKTQLGLGKNPVDIEQRERLKKPGAKKSAAPNGDEKFEPVVRARLSGPTRLVFAIKDAKDAVPKELSVKTLTEWSQLAQVVSERALPVDTPLVEQMKLVGIDQTTNRGEALAKIIQSIRPPLGEETAIEFPYRLILSPDRNARWITPPHELGATDQPIPLWNARIDPSRGGSSVRAIWARDILLDFLRGNPPADRQPNNRPESREPATGPGNPPKPLTLPLSRSDRRELVTLSSVYGLPALRRVVLDKDQALKPGNPGINPHDTDAAGTVVPFPDRIGLWDRRDPLNPRSVPDEGVYVPKPLASADLLLTAMGGTFVGEGQWEPPSPIVYDEKDSQLKCDADLKCDPDLKDNWRPSLRLERWRHRAVLGRDIFVEVAYKGFLFPIGHRASLLKISERRFFPHPVNNRPTAYLIQRLFIVIGKREKRFPAVGQAYDGRLWPAHAITMVTTRTPDLVDPEDPDLEQARKNGRIALAIEKDHTTELAEGLIFWPKTGSGDDQEFEFQFRKDEDAEPIRARLVFVDNVAAHVPDTVEALVKYYRALPQSPWRRARHGSVRRRYAPSQKDGETDFDTQSWELSATGRFITRLFEKGREPKRDEPDEPRFVESFRMDGIMEGADQPPYYPVMRSANVTVQTIDRLVGRPAGAMTVAFNELYVRHGFAPDQNPSELFLDVLSPAIQLDLSGSGDAVGGFAKPSTRLVALSRKFGPVGGRGPAPQPPGRALVRSAANAGSAPVGGLEGLPPAGDYKSFAEGVFDPKEFFGGADKLPKLLGIFSLAAVLKTVAFADGDGTKERKVPKLQEKSLFGGGGLIGEQLQKAKEVIGDVVETLIGGDGGAGGGLIGQALAEIDRAARTRFGKDFAWQTLYPRLGAAFDVLLTKAGEARDALRGSDINVLFAAASALVAAGKTLVAETESVRDNPMPPLVGEFIADAIKQWETLRQLAKLKIDNAEKELRGIVDDLRNAISTELNGFCASLLQADPKLSELLFGDPSATPSCPDFLAVDPAEVYRRFADALLYEIAGEPLMRAQSAALNLARDIAEIMRDTSREAASKLLAVNAKIFDAALALARVAETSGAAKSILNWCDEAVAFGLSVSDKALSVGGRLGEQIERVGKQLDGLKLPAQTPQPVRARFNEARAALAQAHERVASVVTNLQTFRDRLKSLKGSCGEKVSAVLALSGRILALRRDAVAAIQDIVLQVRLVANAIDEASGEAGRNSLLRKAVAANVLAGDLDEARAAVREIVSAVSELLLGITSIGGISAGGDPFKQADLLVSELSKNPTLKRHAEEIGQAKIALMGAARALSDRLAKVRDVDIGEWVAGRKPFPPDLAALGGEILTYATQHDRGLAALVLQAAPTFEKARTALESVAASMLKLVAKPVIAVHDVALAALAEIKKIFDSSQGSREHRRTAEFLVLIISREVVDALVNTLPIEDERAELIAIQTEAQDVNTRAQAFQKADELRKRWGSQEPALVRSVREIARVLESLAHGQLSGIIDLARVRELLEAELKKALLAFVPTRFEVSYDWQTDVQEVPPVFKMKDRPSDDDLVLTGRISIDVLNPGARSSVVEGRLKPFVVNILSKPQDNYLTLTFRKATFSSINGGRPDFSATLDDVQIGTKLQFVKLLQNFLSYSSGGFYVRPTIFPLGIEAGFEFSEDIVPLGGLILYNVGFSVSCKLPFEDRDARFRFALASADAPLIISYPPYGGGGFVALTANGREFVEVECAFEFGAIVGINFGILNAVGRVMAGIYFRQAQGGGAYIKGFVHAVGEGSIACFSICVNIEVAIEHEPTGQVRGTSSYRFTFKVAFAEVSYGFTASYAISGGEGGSNQPSAHLLAIADKTKRLLAAGCKPDELHYKLIERVPPKTRRWKDYRGNFDLELLRG